VHPAAGFPAEAYWRSIGEVAGELLALLEL